MSDRMLSDEILLGLIKKNGGGGGGTTNYNNLDNLPQIGGVTLQGNKTASDLGLANADDVKVKDVKVDNASCVDSNGNAIVAIQKSTGTYSYEISTYDYINTKIVTKHDGVVTDTTIISYETAYTKQTIDDRFTLQYVNASPAWTIELLIDSKDAPAGTKYQWDYQQNPPISDIDFQAGSVQVELSAAYEELNNSIKNNNTAINEIKDGQSIDSFADVESALALKQDKTDNNLQTTDKTIVGAINEHEGDIDSLKSGFTNLDNEVNGDATVYPYADVITIEDAVPANLADCSVKIEPVQDLHGYDKPWVGGAGKNLLETIEIPENTNSGITYSTITDNDDNIIGIKINGTATEDTSVQFNKSFISDGTQYRNCILLSGSYTGSVTHVSYDNNWAGGSPGNIGTPKVLSITTYTRWRISIPSGSTFNNAVFGYIVCTTSADTLSYAPYTNLCPIIGHTEVDVYKAAKNLAVTQNNNSVVCFCKTGQTYTVSTNVAFNLYENSLSGKNFYRGSSPYTFTATKDFGLYFNGWNNPSFIQVELGDRKTPYVPYSGKTYTIALGDTIYGGTVDFDSGVMTVDRACREFDGSSDENWQNQYGLNLITISDALYASGSITCFSNEFGTFIDTIAWSDLLASDNIATITKDGNKIKLGVVYKTVADLTEFKAFLENSPLQICYKLATPTTIQLTPQQIQLLKGTNTLTASTGQISVTVNGVNGSIGAVQEQVNGLAEDVNDITPTLVYTSPTTGTYGDKLAGVKTAFNNLSSAKKKTSYIVLGGSTKYGVTNWNDGIFSVSYYDAANSAFKFLSINLSGTDDAMMVMLSATTNGNSIESRVNAENSNTFALYA